MGLIALFILFMNLIILFQLTFNFIYSTFSNKFSVQPSQRNTELFAKSQIFCVWWFFFVIEEFYIYNNMWNWEKLKLEFQIKVQIFSHVS